MSTVKPRYSGPPIQWSPRYNGLEFKPLVLEITQNDPP